MNKEQLLKFFTPVIEWQKKHNIRSDQILVGEFGAYRQNPGVAEYLKDLLHIFNAQKWHWAFYSFREDDWHGMDYELGTAKPPGKYWEYIDARKVPGKDVYKGSGLFSIIQNMLMEQ